MAENDLTEAIAENAASPKSASADGVSVTQQDLGALIQADKYLKGQEAARSRKKGLQFIQFIPGGHT